MKIFRLGAFLLLGYLMPSWSQDLFELSLEELANVEVQGVTFASETLDTVPASVTIFTDQDIAQLGVQYLHELANFVPGFQSKRQSDNPDLYSLTARGRQIGGGTRSVKISVNGIPVTSPYNESSAVHLTYYPLASVSKVVFVRGPSSVVHGSGALLASINIETKLQDNVVTLGVGNWQHASQSFNLAQNGVFISGQFINQGGDDYSLKEADSNIRVASKDPISVGQINVHVHRADHQFSFSHREVDTLQFYNFARVDNSNNRTQREYTSMSVAKTFMQDAYSDVTFNLYINNFQQDFWVRLGPSGALQAVSNPASNEALTFVVRTDASHYGASLIADHLLPQGKITWGGSFLYDEPSYMNVSANYDLVQLSNQQFPVDYLGANPSSSDAVVKHSNEKTALFAEYQQQLSLGEFTASLRSDYDKRTDAFSWSPRLAWVVNWQGKQAAQNLKIIYSEAFRSPDNLELGTINNPILLGNADLKPEKMRTLELVYGMRSLSQNVQASVYFNELEDGIAQVTDGSVRIFQNTPAEQYSGLELSHEWRLPYGFTLKSHYSHLLDELGNNFRLSDSQGSISLFWQGLPWQASISSFYHGASHSVADTSGALLELPSTWQHNLSLSHRHSKRYQSSVSVKNLMDRQYQTPTVSSFLDEGIPAPGRSVIYQLRLNF